MQTDKFKAEMHLMQIRFGCLLNIVGKGIKAEIINQFYDWKGLSCH